MISKEELVEALKGLTPDQLSGILAQGHGRSPLRPRQLTDLRLVPTATDPRPTWVQDTDGREFGVITHLPYPALLWHRETGQEITVHSAKEREERGDMWVTVAPSTVVADPVDAARRMFESLSPEDQAFVLENQRQARIAAVSSAMGALTPTQQVSALDGAKKPGKGKAVA